ncbi:PstS family phosphate ABC transporter substrate-binding protein [Pseudemcibacter aquimaris]|uniref:PstS family phosphate ABC transporter substrate-binding protein n=1 Tax=Pseudemcibacter aquimaris TaxID=2857064 RepID=UPI00201352AE|nr:PstS family phosphate ABC transporter substrate-binding protein [Pseudemcibacter aquimaris]MCC3860217.1 PstS family phosphate ABC transporter substrate-binding protein [Pseudemcibacter aquimaris]WDU57542.1 PstS family phosphate ABC transporter substrate-binding protein [Pseudemcibacter aquimaris]
MYKKPTLKMIGMGLVGLSMVAAAEARDQIRIVGSSTVFPFSTAVAEEFGRSTSFKTPVVESTGSGGGLKLFCAGVGESHPDITNASRAIKSSEVELCASNGISEIIEIKVGYDGIVFANSKEGAQVEFSLKDIWTALAKEVVVNGEIVPNPHNTWQDVNPALPNTKIEVLGPPPTSGTRDAFAELALEGGCEQVPEVAALKSSDKGRYTALCHTIREDGVYVESGENDNLIVGKLQANPNAYGVFGYSFLEENSDVIQGNVVEGSEPTFENIADKAYKVSRSLFFYVKKAHIGTVPGIQEYLSEFLSDKAMGDFGYLAEKGLIPLPGAELADVQNTATNLIPLSK